MNRPHFHAPSRSSVRTAVLLTGLTVLMVASPAARATVEETNLAQGFEPEKSYEIGEVDHINLFNGNLLLTIPLGGGMQAGPDFGIGLSLVYNGKPWDYAEVGGAPTAVPSNTSNAGLGFQVRLGRVLSPTAADNDSGQWLYEEADGAAHKLYSQLHPGDTVVSGVYYSRDSSYLRLNLSGTQATVHHPDGRRYTFRQLGASPVASTPYSPTRFEDVHGNGFDVSTSGNPWTITGPHGRLTEVHFDKTAAKAGWYASREGVVTRVTVPAAPEAGGRAEYLFVYDAQAPTFYSACAAGGSVARALPLLRSLELPDGSSYDFQGYMVPTTSCSADSGLLTAMKLPTRGVIEWSYGPWKFPVPAGTACKDLLHRPHGVTSRVMKNENGTPVGTRTYTHGYTGPPGCTVDGTPPNYVTTEVKNTLGHRTVHYFSVANVYPGTATWSYKKYGLPVSYHETSGSGGTTGGVSTKVYRGASDSTLIRSTYVDYELDTDTTNQEFNPRRSFERVVHHDDGDRWQQTDSADFDGLGNYRRVTRTTNFPGSATTLETYTDHSGVRPATGAPWLPGLYDRRTLSQDGGAAEVEEFCFSSTTGSLLRHRKLLGTSPGATDLLRVYSYATDGSGYLTREDDYGGDAGGLTTGAICSASSSLGADYSIRHGYQYGVRSVTEYLKSTGSPMPFKVLDRTIQQKTGLVDSERSPSGISTGYEWDAMGRLEWVKPAAGHDAWTQYTYNPAGAGLASMGLYRRANGSESGAVLARQGFTFDAFGRIYRENLYLPDGTTISQRQTLYNGEGWKSSVSEWTLAGASWRPSTVYGNYDPFGRPGLITPPEGSTRAVDLHYNGVRKITRTIPVGTSRNAGGTLVLEPVETYETYDGFGRLYRVSEQSDPAVMTHVTTTYTHDAAGRLTRAATAGQVRELNYDRRGLLRSELQPEKDGYVLYRDHDARGNAWRIQDGDFDLVYLHDRAERVTKVHERTGAQRVWKEFTYDSAAHGGSWDAGQLVTAVRHNWVPVPWAPGVTVDVTVTEETTYSGKGGRPSARATKLNTSGYTFSQSFAWHDLGNLASQTYPVCGNYECTASGGAVSRSVSNTYAYGFLTRVTGYADLTYHVNQALATVAHANGVTDTEDQDPYFRRRPYAIRTSAVPVVLGPYEFDGAGNVTAIGGNRMLYDRTNRLVEYKFESGEKQTYGFDTWGNLTRISTTAGGSTQTRTMLVQGTTNRLSGAGYDAAGNLTFWNGTTHTYDPFGLHLASVNPAAGQSKVYFYTPSDERLYTLDYTAAQGTAGNLETWTLRGLDGKVLREYRMTGGNAVGNWSLQKDYVYRGDRLLAHVPGPGSVPASTVHYTLDHLGTPRLLTTTGSALVSDHHYYGFGEELVPKTNGTMKFTGHERDHNRAGTTDDLDYMHARYYSPHLGRFLSVDPARESVDLQRPQSWNRYGYALGNPVLYTDPNGQWIETASDVAGVLSSAYDFYKEPTLGNGLWLAADTVAAALPFVPNRGTIKLAVKAVEKGADVVKAASKGDEVVDGAKAVARSSAKTTESGIGVTRHGVNQKINREVRSVDELDAIKNPLEVRPVKVDAQGRPSQRSVGRQAEVVRNPDTGAIVSVNPTSTKKAQRLTRGQPRE